MSIDQLAAAMGLTSRTIRTYHARGLLPPAIRIGRKPHYSRAHVYRMRNVLKMQSRGLPLEAIRALLEPDAVLGERLLPSGLIAAVLRADPALSAKLVATGVVSISPDGGLTVRSARAILAARAVHGGEVPIHDVLATLAHSVTAVVPIAKIILDCIGDDLRQCLPRRTGKEEDLLEFVVEVFRLGVLLVAQQHPTQHIVENGNGRRGDNRDRAASPRLRSPGPGSSQLPQRIAEALSMVRPRV